MSITAEISKRIVWPVEISDSLKSALLCDAELIIASSESDLTHRADEGILNVLSGTLTPCMLTRGVRTVTGVVIGRGCWLGNPRLRTMSHPFLQMEVIEPAELVFIPAETCKRIAKENLEIYRLLWFVSAEISDQWLQAQLIGGESTMIRLVYLLLDIAAHQGSRQSCSYPINVSQFQLSTMTAISRPRVNEALKQLEREGLISISRSNISILDFEALGDLLDYVDLSFRDPRRLID